MPSIQQANVSAYHRAIAVPGHGHHGAPGHNMHLIHRDWHQANRDPRPPNAPDENWGTDLAFGTNFLQMHHEMVKATAAEPHEQMMHASIVQWYAETNLSLPAEWDPATVIPPELGYEPDENEFPDEIKKALVESATAQGVSVKSILQRRTDRPNFLLPGWFSLEGVGGGAAGDPLTGARKLADFKNRNQLGCCLVFPHNSWHARIGGAMSSTWTAIADPIFYFGVHWSIDRVFDEYKQIEGSHPPAPAGAAPLAARHLARTPPQLRPPKAAFSPPQKTLIEQWRRESEELQRPPGAAVRKS